MDITKKFSGFKQDGIQIIQVHHHDNKADRINDTDISITIHTSVNNLYRVSLVLVKLFTDDDIIWVVDDFSIMSLYDKGVDHTNILGGEVNCFLEQCVIIDTTTTKRWCGCIRHIIKVVETPEPTKWVFSGVQTRRYNNAYYAALIATDFLL